jgi:ankyrin repeat protein
MDLQNESMGTQFPDMISATFFPFLNYFFQIKIVKYLYEQDPSALEIANDNNNTALHSAVLAGNLDVVKFFIESGKAKIGPGFNGHTLLTEALISGHDDVFRYLLSKEIVDVNSKVNSGQTLVHLAVFQNRTELVKELVREHEADPYAEDDSAVLPQFLAAYKGNLELVQVLNSDYVCTGKNNSKNTLLSIAASEGHTPIIEYILSKYNISSHARVLGDKTMLDIAYARGHLDAIKFLLERDDGDLHIEQIIFNSIDNIRLLESAQAQAKNATVDSDFLTSVFYRASEIYSTSTYIFDYFDKDRALDEVLLLINNAAAISSEERNYAGDNVLQYAAKKGNLQVIKAILGRRLLEVNSKQWLSEVLVKHFTCEFDKIWYL